MSLTEYIKDVENYPSKSKSVILDLVKIVPVDNQGDEVYMLSATAGAGTTTTGSLAIGAVYIRDFKAGYSKSSGKKNAPFSVVVDVNDKLQVSIDGSTYREITLTPGNALTGEDIASDLQTKISSLAGVGGLEVGNVSFLNVMVLFKNNKFNIISGSISNTYTGVGKSSVKVIAGSTHDASATLGFDIQLDSFDLSTKIPSEAVLTSGYTASGLTLAVSNTADFSVTGNAFSISNGVTREYFVAKTIDSVSLTLPSGCGLLNNYAAGSVVQKIFERDSDAPVASPYIEIDDIVRFGLRAIASQIDFSI